MPEAEIRYPADLRLFKDAQARKSDRIQLHLLFRLPRLRRSPGICRASFTYRNPFRRATNNVCHSSQKWHSLLRAIAAKNRWKLNHFQQVATALQKSASRVCRTCYQLFPFAASRTTALRRRPARVSSERRATNEIKFHFISLFLKI